MEKPVLAVIVLAGVPAILFGGSFVAGAMFTMISNDACLTQSSGFEDSPVMVRNFGVIEGDLHIEFKASNSSVELHNISVGGKAKQIGEELPSDEIKTYSLEGFSDGKCTSIDVEIIVGKEGEYEEIEGAIKGEFSRN